MSELIYCATPSRLVDRIEEIMDYVTERGLAPFHPFQAFPYKRFEGNPNIGREKAMEFCFRAIEISNKVWIFGISHGTLQESNIAISREKPVELHLQFDPEWRKYYEELGKQYGNPLDYLVTR